MNNWLEKKMKIITTTTTFRQSKINPPKRFESTLENGGNTKKK